MSFDSNFISFFGIKQTESLISRGLTLIVFERVEILKGKNFGPPVSQEQLMLVGIGVSPIKLRVQTFFLAALLLNVPEQVGGASEGIYCFLLYG